MTAVKSPRYMLPGTLAQIAEGPPLDAVADAAVDDDGFHDSAPASAGGMDPGAWVAAAVPGSVYIGPLDSAGWGGAAALPLAGFLPFAAAGAAAQASVGGLGLAGSAGRLRLGCGRGGGGLHLVERQ